VQSDGQVTALAQEAADLAVTAATSPELTNQCLVRVEFRGAPLGRQRLEQGAKGFIHRECACHRHVGRRARFVTTASEVKQAHSTNDSGEAL
jgi:hypothetical protein